MMQCMLRGFNHMESPGRSCLIEHHSRAKYISLLYNGETSVCVSQSVSPLPKFELNQIGHNSVNFEATASRLGCVFLIKNGNLMMAIAFFTVYVYIILVFTLKIGFFIHLPTGVRLFRNRLFEYFSMIRRLYMDI